MKKKTTKVKKDRFGIKMQIDTTNKIIKVESMVNVAVLIKTLKAMFPKGSPLGYYEEYSIDCNTTIQWYNYPLVVNPVITPNGNWWEYPQPYIGTPHADQMPINICDAKTNTGDTGRNGIYSFNVGEASRISCLNFDNGGVTNVVTKQPDFVTPTIFNVLLN